MSATSIAPATDRAMTARLAGAAPLTLALTLSGTAWLQFLHAREGATEAGEPGALAHWLRGATLALPLVLCAVALATWCVARVLRRLPSPGAGLEGALVATASAA